MKSNKISIAMFVAVAMCGSLSVATNAQSGMMVLPEPTPAPVIRHVPTVVNYAVKPVKQVSETMPSPTKQPINIKGRIVHVQTSVVAPVAAPAPVMVAPMGMGGFVGRASAPTIPVSMTNQ